MARTLNTAASSQANGAPEQTRAQAKRAVASKKIWIDLDNSPHVPFFLPIIEELQKQGHKVLLTARDSYQVCELLQFHHVSCKVVGRHWGRHTIFKVLGTLWRAARLVPWIIAERPDLAVSHGSRGQLVSSAIVGIPTLAILDYEFTARAGFLKADWIFLPHFIPDEAAQPAKKQIMRYPGLKEDVYVPRFRPDPSLKDELRLQPDDVVVTVRPPATEAHYHNPEADVLLKAVLEFLVARPDVRIILLPRNERQDKALRREWRQWIEGEKITIPEHVVDGLNLIWYSDLVISGGGTMNREAAALGVPVYSIFRGHIGGVDKFLSESGRLVLIESVQDVRAKINVQRRTASSHSQRERNSVLENIVAGITSIAEHQCL